MSALAQTYKQCISESQTHRENSKHAITQILLVPTTHIVNAYQKGVVHNPQALQQFNIPLELLLE